MRFCKMLKLAAGFASAVACGAGLARAETPAVQWEIVNRFSPFEVLDDPGAWFDAYRLRDRETWAQWHARKWRDTGPRFASPYADALALGATLPWDDETQSHDAALLRFVREEDSPATTVAVRLWSDIGGPCGWQIGEAIHEQAHCREPFELRVPLSGADVTLMPGAPGATQGWVQARIRPEHMVILALGDSYASGQGNPDLPARWRANLAPESDDVEWLFVDHNLPRPARWLSRRCSRSFFSHQSLTALALASQDPHRFVSFLHFACTGAEIFDGLLNPQKDPGTAKGHNRLSQVNAARAALCKTRSPGDTMRYSAVADAVLEGSNLFAFHRRNDVRLKPGSRYDWRLRRGNGGSAQYPRDGILDCDGEDLRRPDLVLLSVGGNDVGFAELVQYYVAPVRFSTRTGANLVLPDICPAPEFRADPAEAPYAAEYCDALDRTLRYHAGDLIGRWDAASGMRARWHLLFRTLTHYLHVAPERIVMAQYPDPLRASEPENDTCWGVERQADTPGSAPGYDVLSPWNGLKSADPSGFFQTAEFNLRPDEARNLLLQFDALRRQLTITARLEGITLACDGRDAMVGRGWWQGRHRNLPSHGAGQRWRPAQWQPYRHEPDGRAIRTGNDSVLTQATGGVSIEGTAHPNLMGHALIADAVLSRLASDDDIRATRWAARVALDPTDRGFSPF